MTLKALFDSKTNIFRGVIDYSTNQSYYDNYLVKRNKMILRDCIINDNQSYKFLQELILDRVENEIAYLSIDLEIRSRLQNKLWTHIKRKRNQLLRETDHYFLLDVNADYKLNTVKDLKEYRQILRDLTTTYDDPKDVVWPQLPFD